MFAPGSRPIRLALVVLLLGIGAGQYQAGQRGAAAASAPRQEPAAVLIWQGKLLPIVTDVYSSISALGTALSNRDVDGIARVGDQFAAEQQRFEVIAPVPGTVRPVAQVMHSGLRNLANGTKALVIGLRASDNAESQRAANQIVQGDKEFQQAVNQIRRASGPVGTSPLGPSAASTPVPTPIIRGLP